MMGQLVQEMNEAWNERDLLRQRVEELEGYNANLHEKFHALYNGMARMLLRTPPRWTSTTTPLLMVAMVTPPTSMTAPRSRLVALC
jgi:hypothetical protein